MDVGNRYMEFVHRKIKKRDGSLRNALTDREHS
jgi:hypothetical protein